MFNLRFVKTVTEYERYDMLRHDDDSFNMVRQEMASTESLYSSILVSKSIDELSFSDPKR